MTIERKLQCNADIIMSNADINIVISEITRLVVLLRTTVFVDKMTFNVDFMLYWGHYFINSIINVVELL